MTELTRSTYTKVRQSMHEDSNYQMGDERGGSTSIVLNSGDLVTNGNALFEAQNSNSKARRL